MHKILSLVIAFTILFADYSYAGFDEGKVAYKRNDYATALKEWQSLAEQGDARAQNGLGVLYANGLGVAKDYTQAVKWYRKAAEQGNSTAQLNFGILYANGQGVAKDYTQAAKWYRKAAEQGDSTAQFNLGWMYDNGQGVAKDYTQAVMWYRKAAEQGNSSAQLNLGSMYVDGQGVAKDYTQAVKWFQKAADQGDAHAQDNLARAKLLAMKEQQNSGVEEQKLQKTVSMPNGIFTDFSEGKNAFVQNFFYSDGAYIELFFLLENPQADRPMVTGIRVGTCRPNGVQLDCRQTGTSRLPNVNSFSATNVEFSELIKTDADGSFYTKRIKTIVSGKPQTVEDKWSERYHRAKIENASEMATRLRQSIPPQYFVAR